MKILKAEILNQINIPGTKVASDTTLLPQGKHVGITLSIEGQFLKVSGGVNPVLIPFSNLKSITIDE